MYINKNKKGKLMNLEITTPAVMFPSVSLLLLAYTNRFLALASIVRGMNHCIDDEFQMGQIINLQKRMIFIKRMQYLGVSSLLFCVLTMLVVFFNLEILGIIFFVISLLLMIVSLMYSLAEIKISLEALNIHLTNCKYENNVYKQK